MDGVVQDILSQHGFQGSSVYHVASAAEKIADIEPEPRVFEDSDGVLLVQIDEDVDVAAGRGFSSCHRAEDGRVTNPQSPQLLLVSAQGFQHFSEFAGHICR